MPGEFIKVKCECKNEQYIFSKPAGTVKCLVCGAVLAQSTGGKAVMGAKKPETEEQGA